MGKKSLYVAYDGPALATHEMNIRELAPALLAFSALFEEANAIFNKDRAKIAINVKASFKSGSFGIELSVVQDFFQNLLNFGSRPEVASAATLVTLLGFGPLAKGAVHVLRWIKGRKIDKIEIHGTNATLYVGDDFLEIEEKVLRLLKNEKIRNSFEDIIKKPLEREGIDSFGFTDDPQGERIFLLSKEEAAYYSAPKAETEDLGTIEYDTTLQIIGLTFQDNNKWKFSDGVSGAFYAAILDTDFLSKIDNHAIWFGKGDIIKARIRETKSLEPSGTMRAERAIVHVYEHRNAVVQLKLIDD